MLILLALLVPGAALASSTGRTGASTTGCTGGGCHGSTASSSTTVTFASDETTVAPGDTIAVTLTVASSDSSRSYGGLDVSATGGTLSAGSNTRASGGEITHSAATAMTSGAVTFNFNWRAPSTEGTYTLRAAGNAVNGNRASSGDGWNLASNLSITVDDGCDDLDSDGYTNCDNDCDDTNVDINPGAIETCDGVDEDCSGVADDNPVDGDVWYVDSDGDGYGTSSSFRFCDDPGSGYSASTGDCNDVSTAINPGATERCNGLDDNCDGSADGADATDASTWYRDSDRDTYGDEASSSRSCSAPSGYVADATDCLDTNARVNPGGTEVCDAANLDEDCDGGADDADSSASGTYTWYWDGDADGYGDSTMRYERCDQPDGTSPYPDDCDDGDAEYNPGAAETCGDPRDLNCDGYSGTIDSDSDGYMACEECDDSTAEVSPGATERCNLVDDDCDGTVDEGDAADAGTWYADTDGDGHGDIDAPMTACMQPDGYVAEGDDCDDSDVTAFPGSAEVWYDGVDQNCDGNDDDQDGDGFANGKDCDDTNPGIFPGAGEAWYDGVDGDCDGWSDYDYDHDSHDSAKYGGDDCDDGQPEVYPGAPDEPYDGVVTDCYGADEYDQDSDQFPYETDCDDYNSSVNPAAKEVWYDGIDQDCDGNDDDQDGDGVAVDTDCDDTDASVGADCDTGGDDTDGNVDDTDTPGDTDGGKDEDGGGGCGCASAPSSGVALAGLAIAFVVAGSRRRVHTLR